MAQIINNALKNGPVPYGAYLSEMLKRTEDVSFKIVPMNVYCD